MRAAVWLPRLAVIAATLSFATCNTRTPLPGNAVPPTAPTFTVPPAPTPPPRPVDIALQPTGMVSGNSGRGTVQFDHPAPDEGVVLSLSSSDPAVTVTPTEIRVPAGSTSASFSFATRVIDVDRSVNIVAVTPGGSRSTPLGVWGVSLPVFYYYNSDPGSPVASGQSLRLTESTSRFSAVCSGSGVDTFVTANGQGQTLHVGFAAPPGAALRPGVYESSTGATRGPFLGLGQLSCAAHGRFEVREAQFRADGGISRFWVAFELTCNGTSNTVRGELRLRDAANARSSVTDPCRF